MNKKYQRIHVIVLDLVGCLLTFLSGILAQGVFRDAGSLIGQNFKTESDYKGGVNIDEL